MLKWLDKHVKWVFTLPTIIFVLLCVTYPLVYTIQLSFCDWGMSSNTPKVFIGLQNYKEIFTDSRFWDAFLRTILYTVVAVGIETILGVAIGLLLGKVKRGTSVIRTAFLMPMVATPVAVGIIWKLIFDPTIGLANMILRALGLPQGSWLGSADTVMGSLIMIDVWQWTPMIMLMVLAGLSGLGDEIFESARVDGANEWQLIRKITLPMLAPTILMAVLLRIIDALKTFDIIYSTTQGGPGYASENLNILSYRYAFEYFYMGKASALLLVFFMVVLLFAMLYMIVKNRIERRYE